MVEDEELQVYSWRVDELVRAGYEPEVAADLAADTRVDLEEARALARHGCPHTVAVDILREG